jgi:hypothetical protein
MGPPTRRNAPKGAPRTAGQSDQPKSTAQILDDHEQRLRKLEVNKKRKVPVSVVAENGDIWIQGSGWVRRSAAA